MRACGLDFGTSNSAIGLMHGNAPALAPVEGDATLIPSAVFFDYETKGRVLFGADAISTYIGQTEGRLMRALKSIPPSGFDVPNPTDGLAADEDPYEGEEPDDLLTGSADPRQPSES